MSVKLETVVRKYYEALEEGKILGKKCKRCGCIEWPPVYACNDCGSTNMEWYEMSGEAIATSLILASPLSMKPDMNDLVPFALATVVPAEGGDGVNSVVKGVTKKNIEELRRKLPVKVKAEIIQREGYKTVVFNLAE